MDKQLIKNIVSLFGVQGMNYLIPLISLPYLVSKLGPESYGVLGFSVAFVQYFCLLTDYGFNLSATREISINREDKAKVSHIYWSVMACKVVLLIVGIVILQVSCFASSYLSLQEKVLWSAYGITLGNALFPQWLFQGKENMAIISIANVSARLLSVPLIFAFVTSHNDAWIAALITSITSIFGGCISIWLLYKERYVHFCSVSVHDVISQLKDGWHIFLSTAAISLYTTSIAVVLGFVCGSTSVGHFVAADKLRLAVQGLITPISQAVYPKFSAIMSKDKNQGFILLRKLIKYYAVGGLFLSLSLLGCSKFLVEMVYGDKFTASVSVLMLLSMCPFLVAMGNVLGIQTLLALGYKKQFSNILTASGVVNVVVIFPLTYFFAENGAAIAILFTETVVVLLMSASVLKLRLPVF